MLVILWLWLSFATSQHHHEGVLKLISLFIRFVSGVGQPVFTLLVRQKQSQTDKILNLDNSSSHFQCWSW